MNPPNASLAVRASNLVKSYGKGEARTLALKGASLEAALGEMLMIVGPSGCGKTTLLSVICGTLNCDEGEVEVFDHRLHDMSDAEITRFRGQNIGFIFQQFNLIPTLTVVENAAIPLILQGRSTTEAEAAAAKILQEVGLGEKLHFYPRQLSGGQQQRVAISRSLVHQPRLIICDEPTASLDATTGQITMQLLKDSAQKPDRCVIVVTHDSRIFRYADRIVEMEDGRVTGVHDPKTYSHA